MNKIIKNVALCCGFIAMFSVFTTSCYYDNEEELYPNAIPCDTASVGFTDRVWPIINDNCYGCHSGSAPAAGISLIDYETVKAAALVPAGQFGSLSGTINHNEANSPMPKNAGKLSDCNIAIIDKWISEGAPNN